MYGAVSRGVRQQPVAQIRQSDSVVAICQPILLAYRWRVLALILEILDRFFDCGPARHHDRCRGKLMSRGPENGLRARQEPPKEL